MRALHTSMQVELEFIDDIIKACCKLYNLVRKRDDIYYEDAEMPKFDDTEACRTGTRLHRVEMKDNCQLSYVTLLVIHSN